MIISTISKNGKEKGNILLLENNKEGQTLIEALEYYVANNKRKTTAKKMLKEFNENLCCYP